MVSDQRYQYASQWEAIRSIAANGELAVKRGWAELALASVS